MLSKLKSAKTIRNLSIVLTLTQSFLSCGDDDVTEDAGNGTKAAESVQCPALDLKTGDRVGISPQDPKKIVVGEISFIYKGSPAELETDSVVGSVQGFLWKTQNSEYDQPLICYRGNFTGGCHLVQYALAADSENGLVMEEKGSKTAVVSKVDSSSFTVSFTGDKTVLIEECPD